MPVNLTPAFEQWFEGSKVVDATGKPLVVFHGTRQAFGEFKNITDDLGFHFGSQEAAQLRLDNSDGTGGESILQLYLSITNPAKLSDIGDFGDAAALALDMEQRQYISRNEYNQLGQMQGIGLERNTSQLNALRNILKCKGYDGVEYANMYESEGDISYIAFDPNQIKSAIGNNGDFDTANPDIRFSMADLDEDEATNDTEAPCP